MLNVSEIGQGNEYRHWSEEYPRSTGIAWFSNQTLLLRICNNFLHYLLTYSLSSLHSFTH